MARTGRPKVERVQVACAGCGKLEERRVTDLARRTSGRVFCSKECQDRIGSKPRRKQEKSCEQCGVSFYPESGGPNRFCSRDCQNAWQGRNAVWDECEVCGKAIRKAPSQIQTKKYCSHECQGKAVSRRAIGREHNGKPVLMTSGGYLKVWEPGHPAARANWVLEHRLVVEKVIGRYLDTKEHIHHKDGNKTNNHPDNLEIMSHNDHSRLTTGRREAAKKRERAELLAKIAEYEQRFGPLTEE